MSINDDIHRQLEDLRDENRALAVENARLKAVASAVFNCNGIRLCIERGCSECVHNNTDCNSRDVVKAIVAYREGFGCIGRKDALDDLDLAFSN